MGPAQVAAVLHGLGRRGAADRGAANPRTLDLGQNELGELGTAALARYLKADGRLEELRLSGADLPRSTTRAMVDLGLAFEAHAALAVLDLSRTDVPARVAAALRRTIEKRPAVPLPKEAKFAFLGAIRRRAFLIDEDSLRAIFGFARRKRVLRLGQDRQPLADVFNVRSPAARALVDRMESGELLTEDDEAIAEINDWLQRFEPRDQDMVRRAYWTIQTRRQQEQDADDGLEAFVNEGPPPDSSDSDSSDTDSDEAMGVDAEGEVVDDSESGDGEDAMATE